MLAIMTKRLIIFSLISLSFAASFTVGLAQAQNGLLGEESDAVQGGAEIHKILQVLRQKPESTSTACLQALSAMHKAQNELKQATEKKEKSDIALARDIFGSSLSDATIMCGADAHTLCRKQQFQNAHLTQYCPLLHPEPGDDVL
ncbi:hypothetical protein [Aristophania vespae]|uniref:hypothetical protein n=1 Tax=Aristophania vespae TaxID=2697033 RepID=UPI00235196D8|nr:hypothetical protein [Aristophania vespae]UMM63872.1 hypothetical protein DM15PD_08500 [Aristophania vespae]